jgi:Heterokaryon incompatibility protein (HET)
MTPEASDGVLTESLVVLSAENTQALLSTASEEYLRRQAEANTILDGLQKLNPIIAKDFHPKQTAIADLKLRMICSQPQTPGVEIVVPSFIVVSYCWHYPAEWTLAPAAQAQKIKPGWKISQSMANAVLSLRSPDEGVWLDKLCINQSDDSEKAVAIGSMDIVYRSARRLLILLEDVQLDAGEDEAAVTYAGIYEDLRRLIVDNGIEGAERDKLMQKHKYFVDLESKLDEKVVQNLGENGKRFAKKLLTARWFSRAWCAHESKVLVHPTKGNNPLFLCFGADGRVLSFEFRFVHYLTLRYFNAEPLIYSSPPNFNDPNPVSFHQLYARIQRLQSHAGESKFSLMQSLDGITSLGCLKKEDMVSIALNTARIPLFYTGHLNTCEDVIWVVALLTIASGDVLPLVMDGTKLRVPDDDGTKTIVSWVDQPQVLKSEVRIPLIDSNSITAVTKEYIELDILLFTDLPKRPSPASMEKASVFAEAHYLDGWNNYLSIGAPEEVRNAHNYLQGRISRRYIIQTWLALALDCGIDWIKRLPSLLIEQTADSWTLGEFTVNSLFPANRNMFEATAIHFLSLIGINEENTPDFTRSYLDWTVKFFECLLDSRLKILTDQPRRLCVESNDWAITRKAANTSWIAVPAAVAHLPLWLQKAWVIESFDPAAPPERPEDHWPDMTKEHEPNVAQEDIWPVLDSDMASRRAPRNDERGTWRLRQRQVIFGCQSIVPDGKSVVLLKKQKIYGAENYDWAAMTRAAFGDREVPPMIQGMLDGKSFQQIVGEK